MRYICLDKHGYAEGVYSAELAQLVLQQYHSRDPRALLNSDQLRDANVVELG